MSLSHRLVISVASALVGLPVGVWGACNQIPSTDALRAHAITDGLNAPSAEAMQIASELDRRSAQWTLPFKGAFGRASRAVIFPDDKAGVAVAPDWTCVGGGHAGAAAPPAGKDALVGAILYPTRAGGNDGLPAYVRLFAAGALCDAIEEAVGGRGGKWPFFGERVRLLGCSNDGVRFTRHDPEDIVPYVLTLPVVPISGNDAPLVSANVRIAVFRAPTAGAMQERAKDVKERVDQLADPQRKCKSICAETPSSLDVCIDDLYETLPALKAASGTQSVQDSIGCNIAIPQQGIQCHTNDFQELCAGPNTAPGLSQCLHSKSGVKYWRSNCGAIHFPFTYAGIRKPVAAGSTTTTVSPSLTTTTGVDRILQGITGEHLEENSPPQADPDARIYLPGSEFVGATLCVTQCSDPPCSNAGEWRVPDLDVWYQDGSDVIVGLRGVADKSESVIDVVPALKAVWECSNGEACTKVGWETGERKVLCACSDRYEASCKCKPADPPKFFECVAPPGYTGTYAYAGMPCTRPDHCPEGGSCTGQPLCLPPGQRIWGDKAVGVGSGCQEDSQCAPGLVCGHRLFDFADRVDANQVGTLNEKFTGAATHRRGFCHDDPKKGCKGPADCTSNVCEGYRLDAEGKP
jgi:hypothetical protein